MSGVAPGAPVLAVRRLASAFLTGGGWRFALRGVELTVPRGKTVALVGESGSGKSVTALSIMRLLRGPAARIVSGEIMFRGRDGAVRDLAGLDEPSMRAHRGDEIGMIFQEPMSSLNPTATVGAQIAQAIRLHRPVSSRAAHEQALHLLEQVHLRDPRRQASAYPHQLSGGMCQRVMIAIALANRPSLLLADEPTTALDVTVQAQIIRLILTLQGELGMGVLFITHDLGVVAEVADRVDVMYAGQVVESAPVGALFDTPCHPYTRALLASRPAARSGPVARAERPVDEALEGCRYAAVCNLATDLCREAMPGPSQAGPDHWTRCWRWREVA